MRWASGVTTALLVTFTCPLLYGPHAMAQAPQRSLGGVRVLIDPKQEELYTAMGAQLHPLTDLQDKLGGALEKLRQDAFNKNDAELTDAIRLVETELQTYGKFPTTSKPELENLRTIFEQQTAARTKAIQVNMMATLKTWKTRMAAEVAKTKKANSPEDYLQKSLLENIEVDLKRLSEGQMVWSEGDTWFDVMRDGHYFGGDLPKKLDSGILLTSTNTNRTPELTSYARNTLPVEIEATVAGGDTPFYISFAGTRVLFRYPEVPGNLKLIYRKGMDWDSQLVTCKPLPEGAVQKFELKIHEAGFSIKCNGVTVCDSDTPLLGNRGSVSIGVMDNSSVEVRELRFRSPGHARYLSTMASNNASYKELSNVLSAAKRIPVQSLPGMDTATPAPAGKERPQADKFWPTTLGLYDAPEVEEAVEDPEKRVFIYKSPNYQFVCDSRLSVNVVREFGRVFEATYQVNCKLPLDIQPEPEIFKPAFTARIITSDESYHMQGGAVGSAGVYIPSAKSILVPISSLGVKLERDKVTIDPGSGDYHTLIHEITHQMMNRWLDKLPLWLLEGSAEYVAWASYSRGKFTFTDMHRNFPEKLERRGFSMKSVNIPHLADLMTFDHPKWNASIAAGDASGNYTGAALLTYYFYKLDGKRDGADMVACFNAVRNGTAHADAIKTHLLKDRSYDQLQTEVAAAFSELGVTIYFKSKTP